MPRKKIYAANFVCKKAPIKLEAYPEVTGELDICWAEGMIGALAVFEEEEHVKKFCDKYNSTYTAFTVEPRIPDDDRNTRGDGKMDSGEDAIR